MRKYYSRFHEKYSEFFFSLQRKAAVILTKVSTGEYRLTDSSHIVSENSNRIPSRKFNVDEIRNKMKFKKLSFRHALAENGSLREYASCTTKEEMQHEIYL
jgi:hypothetical protein